MAMYGATAAKLGILGVPMSCNQACCALLVDSNIADYRFIYYFLLIQRERIRSLANGAAQQNLSASTVGDLSVTLPDLFEQQAIAGVLGALDDKIAVNDRIAPPLKSWLVQWLRSTSRPR